jgi:hypothetical protein
LRVWRHLGDDEKKALSEKARSVEFDEYDQALSGWMKRLVVGAKEATVPADVAAYLERVAWEEYQAFQKRLGGAHSSPDATPIGESATTQKKQSQQ